MTAGREVARDGNGTEEEDIQARQHDGQAGSGSWREL